MAAVTRLRRVPRAPIAGTITKIEYNSNDYGSRNDSATQPINAIYDTRQSLATLEPIEQPELKEKTKIENDITPEGPKDDDLL